jgi:hypothetical protein
MNRILLSILLLVVVCACSKGEDVSPVTVNKQGNLFVNEYFALSISKPEGWYAQSAEETIALQQRGNALVAGDDKGLQAMIEASMQSSLPLFGFFEYPPGTPRQLNPNVLGVAENIGAFPGIKTGCDYLHHVKTLISQSKAPYEFKEGCGSASIGGREFGRLDAKVKMGDNEIGQSYYAVIQAKHAVSIVQTYMNIEGKAKTDDVIESVKFSN